MLKWHGYVGILLIFLGEFLIFHRIEPFSTYLFFLLLWLGYILLMDSLVYYRTNKSRFSDSKSFFGLFLYSALFWWFYEILNFFIENWRYEGVGEPRWLIYTLAFSTVLPAILETSDLLQSFHFIQRKRWKINITNHKLAILISLGLIFLILPFVIPLYTFPLVWLSMYFLLDPVNYLLKRHSILADLEKGKAGKFWSLMFGSLICGFFWEFWNYWAPVKWSYDVPFFEFFKIFEMPILGYLGYLPFGLSLYALYHFATLLIEKKK